MAAMLLPSKDKNVRFCSTLYQVIFNFSGLNVRKWAVIWRAKNIKVV